MSESFITVDNLGKKYIIGHQQQEGYTVLRDVIANGAKGLLKPFLNRKSHIQNSQEEFWALKDVSFEIKQGDRVGIIGRNGAGKSTLLKILSRITEPTKGSIKIKGRVASLLEVGTGFHPELTGRENIYLNGAILGLSKVDIKRKFDEIVAFAEVEKFLDTPVKRYSSGMYVRLAFAVAAHLEPEILIVDEVLAVGDALFQKKCLGKMQNVASEGRTVIFVSHQMATISNLCSSCIILQSGELAFYGKTESAIRRYLDTGNQHQQEVKINLQAFRPSWAKPLITSARILDLNGHEQTTFPLGAGLIIEMTFNTYVLTKLKAPVMGVVINHATFGTVGGVNTRMTGFETDETAGTAATMQCILKESCLLQGNYYVDVWLGDGSTDVDTLTGYLSFRIEETDVYGTGRTPFANMGVIFLDPVWNICTINY
ncbi:ABC transporter ATP-binding protein [Nostoc commune NIES-4072]|uniref:ABC transporter ATP-binding protein n=1 Tax=Nostoc commune NIES-4072 TaxID=2005467 RepID=A0A2R5FP48_NOSCO|nr:ABC transporter ATP-binding protein [Nostoc commune]BBD69183.1 ABC transporter ATP-binding protein [Nostoc commune HK-02]GBG19819.1 ABC transporter ATP-binding protein [Nostoc commune NIES-4072]